MKDPTVDTSGVFAEVNDTETPKDKFDPTMQLYHLPEDVEWFISKKYFNRPKTEDDCTAALMVRFVSWQIQAEFESLYKGTGISKPGTLRNQLVSRYHPIPDDYGDENLRGRIPCNVEFGETCKWCGEKVKAEKRYPRDSQPPNYFREVIAKFKAKDRTVMMGEIYKKDGDQWVTDGKLYAFEFSNYVRIGRPFTKIIDDRANDADNRIRIDKKTYAGYVNPVAIKVTYSWPCKNGKPDNSQYSTWSPTDATPFPPEAGGPDVSVVDKEWAIATAQHDPAGWVNREAFAGQVDPVEVGKHVFGVFNGDIKLSDDIDISVADFGQLLELVEDNKEKFPDLDTNEFTYDMVEALRAIVKGVLHGGN